MIDFRNVDMAELLIHTLTERVAITEGHLFRVAFAIFFQLSQAAEFQDVPLFPGVFFLPGNKKRPTRMTLLMPRTAMMCLLLLMFSAPIIC